LLKGSVATDQDSRLSWNAEHTRSSVKFAGEEELEEVSDEEGIFLAYFCMKINKRNVLRVT